MTVDGSRQVMVVVGSGFKATSLHLLILSLEEEGEKEEGD